MTEPIHTDGVDIDCQTVSFRRLEEIDTVISWRVSELERAGYCDESAVALALAPEVDLHRAVDLLQRGCPVELAVRILL